MARHRLRREVPEDLRAPARARRERSAARFVCHVALADRGRILFETTGIIEGEIAPEPRGTNGFGYDPIFFYPPYGCTLAELDLERKATVSHRGKAFSACGNS